MKIAYVTTYDSSDVRNWSGIGFYLRRTLEAQGNEILPIGRLRYQPLWPFYPKAFFYKYILRKKYHIWREPLVLNNLARQVNDRLADQNYDIFFCPGTSPISYIDKKKPIVLWLGSTFASAIDYYPSYKNLAKETIRNANKTTQLALDKADLIIIASEWAMKDAQKHYSIDPKKLVSIPWGANLEYDRALPEIETLIDSKRRDACKLLFIGVDWERKGGDIAVKVVELLNKKGIQAELHVVGCEPESLMPSFVVRHGFISKNTVEGQKELDQLFSEAHFFFLPTQAEMFGIVFAEASSWGVPSITTNTGGVQSAVRNGINGFTLDVNADPEEYAEIIAKCFFDKTKYRVLALSSFREYQDRLNWDVAGKAVNKRLLQLIEAKSG